MPQRDQVSEAHRGKLLAKRFRPVIRQEDSNGLVKLGQEFAVEVIFVGMGNVQEIELVAHNGIEQESVVWVWKP